MRSMDELAEAERYPVRVIGGAGGDATGELQVWEEAPGQPGAVLVRLVLGGEAVQAVAEDCFAALVELRRELEATGRLLVCNGSSLDVYPSGMSRSMGVGQKAYRLTMGRQALMADLVSIFETAPGVRPSRVDQQAAFFERWIASLRG